MLGLLIPAPTLTDRKIRETWAWWELYAVPDQMEVRWLMKDRRERAAYFAVMVLPTLDLPGCGDVSLERVLDLQLVSRYPTAGRRRIRHS